MGWIRAPSIQFIVMKHYNEVTGLQTVLRTVHQSRRCLCTCPVYIAVTPHVCVCRSSLYGTSCPPVWNKMAAQTPFPLLWPRTHGPWPPTVRTRSSTGWFLSVVISLEQPQLGFSDLIRGAWAVKTEGLFCGLTFFTWSWLIWVSRSVLARTAQGHALVIQMMMSPV